MYGMSCLTLVISQALRFDRRYHCRLPSICYQCGNVVHGISLQVDNQSAKPPQRFI